MNRAIFLYDQPPWHLKRTGFPSAWRLAGLQREHGRPVRIGILDTGIDLRNAYVRQLIGEGYNAIQPGRSPQDEHGHGTHVAGLIATATRAWKTPPGRTPPVTLYPVKIFDETGCGQVSDIIRGLSWCKETGVDLVNLSFGTEMKSSLALHQSILDLDQAGILLVGAAGNDGRGGAVDFPGRYGEVLAVAASTRFDNLAPFSSSGPEVDLIAPGAGVISLARDGAFARMSGTSMAAPHVTAAAALALWAEPGLDARALREGLQETAEWLPTLPGRAQGAGLLRADRLLRWVQRGRAPLWS